MQQARALRPMGFLEVVDQTFRLYRANFGLFFMMAAVLYIPAVVLSAVPVLGAIASLLSIPASFLAYGALTKAVSDRYLGNPTDMGSAYRYVWARFWPLVGTLLLAYLLLLVIPLMGIMAAMLFPVFAAARAGAAAASGMPSAGAGGAGAFVVFFTLFMVVVVVLMIIWMAFVTPVVVVEDARGVRAIRRGWFLIRQWTWWRVLWVYVVLLLIIGALAMVLFGAAAFLPGHSTGPTASPGVSVVALLIFAGAESVLWPLFLVALILIYYDSRIRKEGFDLQVLAREMGVALPESATQPATAGMPGAAYPTAPPSQAPPVAPPPAAAYTPPAAPPAPAPPPTAPASTTWKPSDPRLASRMPLSGLRRIFVFTDSDGRATPGSAAVIETVQDTAGAPLSQFQDHVGVNIIGGSDAGAEVTRTRTVPESVWEAMSRIDGDLTARARNGQARTCVRGFSDSQTGEHGVIIMVYDA